MVRLSRRTLRHREASFSLNAAMNPMVTYEVSVNVDSSLADKYEAYMRDKHLADVLASGCFVDATLERAGAGKYRTRYRARSQADVDRYLRDHTQALRG